MKKLGFTLIEILVVVVIIGILGAIALPQYQRSVLRSRFAALMPIAKSMADSNEAFYLEHGEYADNAQDLPIQGRQNYPNGTELEFGTSSDYSYVLASNTNGTPNNVYVQYQKHSKNFAGNIHCEAADDDELATWLCRDALHGTPVNTGEIKSLSGEGYTAYVLSGSTTSSTFDRSCEGEPETVTELCAGGCGFMSATPTCNLYTGQWEEQDFDPSVCPVKPANQTANCSSGSGKKTRAAKCKADKSGYEWGAWDESACCTGTPPSLTSPEMQSYCHGENTGTQPRCVNGQWEWTSFNSNITCSGQSYNAVGCTATGDGASNGGSCTGTYTGSDCYAAGKYGCANSTFRDQKYKVSGQTFYNYAMCSTKAEYGCANSTFESVEGEDVTCSSGAVAFGCANSTFTGKHADCRGSTNGCANSTFTNGARCIGSGVDACKGSTFKSGAACVANKAGACNNVTYNGGCCYSSSSGYCPAGSPKCNYSNGSYIVSGTTW